MIIHTQKYKCVICTGLVLLTIFFSNSSTNAQDINISDATNADNATGVNDYGLTTGVTTFATSTIGYRAIGGGNFYHLGPINNGAGIGTLHVAGSYNANFTPGVGTSGNDYFSGSTIQQLTGNVAPLFGNLFLQNGAANQFNVLNTAGADVGNNATFSNGITTTVRNTHSATALRFLDNATYAGSVNNVLATSTADAQHVDGYITKIGNDAFIYPVGSGIDARPLQISAPALVTDAYAVAWIAGDPSITTDPSGSAALHPVSAVVGGIRSVSRVGQWDWIAQSGTGAGLTITVSIPDMTAFSLTNRLRLVGWDGVRWIDLSGVATATGNTENSLLSGTMIPGITAIGIGSIDWVLSATFTNFNANVKNCNTKLSWTSVNEGNLSAYVIEYSNNGITFSTIGNVPKQFNYNNGNYTYIHNNPEEGKAYYRLKMVSINGAKNESNQLSVNVNCGSRLTIGPNPVVDQLIISGILPGSQIAIYNSFGRLLKTLTTYNQTQTIDMNTFAPGLYEVRVMKDGQTLQIEKLLKQ